MPPVHPFIPVPGVVRLALEGTQAGRPFANIFHVEYTGGPPTAPNLHTWAGSWYAAASAALASLAGVEATYEDVVATDLSSITGAQVTAGSAVPGTMDGGLIPANSAMLINFNSSFRYRGGHPRAYLVAGDRTVVDTANQWDSAFVTTANASWGSVATAFTAAGTGFTPTSQCAVSYRSADAYRVVPLIMPIATYAANAGIATMRRRMRK
jgi:hypothetical protein